MGNVAAGIPYSDGLQQQPEYWARCYTPLWFWWL